MSKHLLYQDLIKQMKKSYMEDFYMEACWIQYAIIEDRLNSVIRHAYPEKGEDLLKTLRGLDRKLDHVKNKVHPRDYDCLKTVHKELLGRIKSWKDIRNDLMHEITNSFDFDLIQDKLKMLSADGSDLVNELSSKVRKYKKLVKKRK